jgi:hypothetical protein
VLCLVLVSDFLFSGCFVQFDLSNVSFTISLYGMQWLVFVLFVMLRNPSDDAEFYLGIQNLPYDMGVVCNVSPENVIISQPTRMNIH